MNMSAPKSSRQLILEHSQARYLKVNRSGFGTKSAEDSSYLARDARQQMADKWGTGK
jgi:hypothetical protein